jgi:alpha-beta hydrolase superfamily lysophospholipase
MHYFYVHGFASSPASRKAAFFRKALTRAGCVLHCPDFNEPDFATLTVSRMLDQLAHEASRLTPGPMTLFGSSLGGFVALHAAASPSPRHPVGRLVLLAPAFDFARNRKWLGAEGLEGWRATDALEVFHHGYGEPRAIGYALNEDALQFDSYRVTVDLPILIFQGRQDEVVDPSTVERFARGRRNVTLRLLDDDHQLLASLGIIWRETAAFLGLKER